MRRSYLRAIRRTTARTAIGCMFGALALTGAGLAARAPASASSMRATPDDPSCPAYNDSHTGWLWTASGNNEVGVRAPVETLFDGLLCVPEDDDAYASGWAGIEDMSTGEIAQAGIVHTFHNGVASWCRFYATGVGVPTYYDCGDQSNGTYVFFLVQKYSNTMGSFYDIEDCGTSGGYGNCTPENPDQPAFSQPDGVVSAEANYACKIQLMGSASAPENYGTSAYPLQGLVEDWETREWDYVSSANKCPSDYEEAQSTDVLSTWDSRN
jgi:hypothetical protein